LTADHQNGVKIEFEPCAEDGNGARRAYYASLRPRSEQYLYFLLICVGLLFIIGQLVSVWRSRVHGGGLNDMGYRNWFEFIVGLLLLLEGWFLVKRGPIYSFRPPGRTGAQELEIGEEGIVIGSPDRFAVSSLAWHDFSRFVETDNLFVLLSLWPSNVSSLFAYRIRGTARSLYVIPKRAFTPPAAEQFRNLLKRHVRMVTPAGNPDS
jgi:hypothetical protein